MRECVDALVGFGYADFGEEFDDPLAGLALGHAQVDPQWLRYLAAHRVGRIQRSRRLLEDDADFSAANRSELVEIHPDEFTAVQHDGLRRGLTRVGHQAHQ